MHYFGEEIVIKIVLREQVGKVCNQALHGMFSSLVAPTAGRSPCVAVLVGTTSAVDVSTRVAARHLGPMFRPGRPSGRVTAVGRACCEADRPFSIGARLVLMNVGSARRVLSHTRVINQLSCCLATLQHRRVYEGERQGECAALFRECFAHCVLYRPVQTNGGNMPSHMDGQRPLRLITIAGGGKRPGPAGRVAFPTAMLWL